MKTKAQDSKVEEAKTPETFDDPFGETPFVNEREQRIQEQAVKYSTLTIGQRLQLLRDIKLDVEAKRDELASTLETIDSLIGFSTKPSPQTPTIEKSKRSGKRKKSKFSTDEICEAVLQVLEDGQKMTSVIQESVTKLKGEGAGEKVYASLQKLVKEKKVTKEGRALYKKV